MSTIMLPVTALKPNDYNPNQMSAEKFAELVTEVQHLSRLPKPVIVRANGLGYSIVDGEHGWRAAQEVGLEKIPCEVIEADDFEAMRQTYKRNQHGTHNSALLGRMFRCMMDERQLSQRALAVEVAVSEGTIRNALLYAEAVNLRNSYAFDQLSVRQIRTYLFLPDPVRDIWLDAGADLKALQEALRVRIEVDGKEQTIEYEPECLQEIVDAGVVETLEGTNQKFVSSVRRAFQLRRWQQDTHGDFDDYVKPVARLHLPVETLDRFLPCTVEDDKVKVLISPEQWCEILTTCVERASLIDDCFAMIRASIRLTLRKAGTDLQDVTDPRVAELLDIVRSAPDFIQAASLSLSDKVYLTKATADVPEEILLQAKQEACKTLQARDGWLTADPELLREGGMESLQARLPQTQAEWSTITAESALNQELAKVTWDTQIAERNALFANQEQLHEVVVEHLKTSHNIREGNIAGRPTYEVLEERLRRLPWPEFVMLAAYVLGHDIAAAGFWEQAVLSEQEPLK